MLKRSLAVMSLSILGLFGCASQSPVTRAAVSSATVPSATVSSRTVPMSTAFACIMRDKGCAKTERFACLRDGNVASPTFMRAGRCVDHVFAPGSECASMPDMTGICVYDGPCVEMDSKGKTYPISCTIR